ncbi:Glucosaminyl phosphatidylinositol (GlcN-PI) nositol acylation protein, partial [Exophiala xenobiotica]
MTPQEAASYKSRKEAFVSNLSGSSLNEINLVTLVASAAVLLWTVLQKRQSFFTPYTPISLIADFLLNVCGILFAITLYSSAPLVLSIFLITPSLLLFFLTSAPSNSSSSSTTPSSKPPKKAKASSSSFATSNAASTAPTSPATATLPVRPFLTHYRGSMMIATCLSILAVDFRIFPRRFAKVETWGTSLMDLG